MNNKDRFPRPYIAREGHRHLIILLFLAWASFLMGAPWLSWLIFGISLFVVQFFRDPIRFLPDNDPTSVVSPADGRIIAVERTGDPYRQGRESIKISIFMNVFNVHANSAPLTGTVENIFYFPGTFINASLDKASSENERNAVLLKTDSEQEITCVQVAGLIARRILCYINQGDRMERGSRYGFIRFGSRVDLYLPPNAAIKVTIGDKVKAVQSLIAKIKDQDHEGTG